MKSTKHFLPSFFLSLLLGICAFAQVSNAAGIGNSPAWIKNDHVLPGMSFNEVINVNRTDATNKAKLDITMTGNADLIKWITIVNKDNLVFKKGQKQLPMTVSFTIPKNAEIKTYSADIYGNLTDLGAKPALKGIEVAIVLGIHVPVKLTVVGKQITDYNVSGISVGPQKDTGPLFISMNITNTGNTGLSSLKGKVTVYDTSGTKVLESFDFLPLSEAIAPEETKTEKMIFSDYVPPVGKYWIDINAINGAKSAYHDRFLLITKGYVEPTPAPKPSAPNVKPAAPVASAAPADYSLLVLGGGVVIIALAAILIYLRKKRPSGKIN